MPRVNKAKKYPMIEMYPGERIGSSINVKPAPYLHVIEYDHELDMGIVMKRGTILTFDANGYLIPCVGGSTVTVTYDARDVELGVHDLDTSTVVLEAKVGTPTSASLFKGYAVGVAQYDIYQYSPENHDNYKIQDNVAILEDYCVLYEVSEDMAAAYTGYGTTVMPGHILIPNNKGFPVPLTSAFFTEATAGSAAEINVFAAELVEAVNYKVGKLVRLIDITKPVDKDFLGGYDKVITVPGLDLPGHETNGIQTGINASTKKGILVQLQF
jgi:hypothetical protein